MSSLSAWHWLLLKCTVADKKKAFVLFCYDGNQKTKVWWYSINYSPISSTLYLSLEVFTSSSTLEKLELKSCGNWNGSSTSILKLGYETMTISKILNPPYYCTRLLFMLMQFNSLYIAEKIVFALFALYNFMVKGI